MTVSMVRFLFMVSVTHTCNCFVCLCTLYMCCFAKCQKHRGCHFTITDPTATTIMTCFSPVMRTDGSCFSRYVPMHLFESLW